MEFFGIDLVIWLGIVVASGMALLIIWKTAQWKGRFDQWKRRVDERLDDIARYGVEHGTAHDATVHDVDAVDQAATHALTTPQTLSPTPTTATTLDPTQAQGSEDRLISEQQDTGPLLEEIDAKTVMQMESAMLDALSGRKDEAIEQLKAAGRAIGIHTRDDVAMAHHNLGNLLYRSKQFDEAEKEYRDAINCKPDLARAHANLGFLYQRLGRREEALQEFKTALELKDQLPDGGERITQIVEGLSREN